MVRTYTCKRLMRRLPVALLYHVIVGNTNTFVMWQQLQSENNSKSSKKKEKKFLVQIGKELSELQASSFTSMMHVTLQQNKCKGQLLKIRCHKQKRLGPIFKATKTKNDDKFVLRQIKHLPRT